MTLRTELGQILHIPATIGTVADALNYLSVTLGIPPDRLSIGGNRCLPRGTVLSQSKLPPDSPFFMFTIMSHCGGQSSQEFRPLPSGPGIGWTFLFKDREDYSMVVPWEWRVTQIKEEIGKLVNCPWHRIDLVMDSHIIRENARVRSLDVTEHPVVAVAVCKHVWPPTGEVTDIREGEWYERLIIDISRDSLKYLDEIKREGMTHADAVLMFLRAGGEISLTRILLENHEVGVVPLS
jgi:hypothetical protein